MLGSKRVSARIQFESSGSYVRHRRAGLRDLFNIYRGQFIKFLKLEKLQDSLVLELHERGRNK